MARIAQSGQVAAGATVRIIEIESKEALASAISLGLRMFFKDRCKGVTLRPAAQA